MVKYMSTRMDKYYSDSGEENAKRTSKNRNIYGDISDEEYDKLNLTNNISVIDTPLEDLDIDKIKAILEEKYKEKKRTSISVEDMDLDEQEEELESTKEYDLKKVLETAHKNKKVDYDQDRFAKVHEQEYDILKSLNIGKKESVDEEEAMSVEDTNLMNLIKTVNYNAEKFKNSSNSDDDDLLADLKGGDDTEIIGPGSFEEKEKPGKKRTIVEELERTKQLSKQDIETALEELDEESDDAEETDTPLTKTEELSNSFYTGKFQINDDDMDFKDLENAVNGGSIVIKILITIVVLALIGLAIFLLNKYLNLGLF